MLIGDVLATLSLILLIGSATWATMVLYSLLFPTRVQVASRELEYHPWKSLLVGGAVLVPISFVAIALLAAPNPLAKFLGVMVAVLILSVALLGGAGLALLVGRRVKEQGGADQQLRAFGRSAGILVVAGLLPFVGWFVLAPIVLVAGCGAGVRSLFERQSRKLAVPTAAPPIQGSDVS